MSSDSPIVCVVGTFDTKGKELEYIASCLRTTGVNVRTIDLSTSGNNHDFSVTVPSSNVAEHHPTGWKIDASGTQDRGQAITAMSSAFEHYLASSQDVAGVIGVGGSGGTALISPGFRRLPVGLPKVLVSTMASGDVGPYVGGSDITMMHSVTDVEGLNAVSLKVLGNAAHALSGMVNHASDLPQNLSSKPAIGLTMFGVTTPCIKAVTAELDTDYDCLVFHATGTGGRCMENLVDSGMLKGVLDLTTTEVADMLFGGVLAATEDRFDSIIRTGVPYVGSVGAMDMINFGERSSVPEKFNDRLFHIHNDQVTLMRTTVEENRHIGEWVASKLNAMTGPVRFLIPEGGVSLLDVPGGAFHDPAADRALFESLEQHVQQTTSRKLIRIAAAINDEQFSTAAVDHFREIT